MTPARTPTEPAAWHAGWSLQLRLWIASSGQAVLGKGRAELLEGIDRWHSISAAARRMGMSYRRAWLLVRDVNRAAGAPLVEAAVGGKQGGGARLTPRGRAAVELFRELERQLTAEAGGILARRVAGTATGVLHVSAAVSLEEVLGQLLADYSLRQPAVRARAVFGGSDELAEHVLAGSPCDLFLSADDAQFDRLANAGLVERGAAVPLAENGLSAIAAADSPAKARQATDLLRPRFARVALADGDCPLGRYTRSYLRALSIDKPLSTKALWGDNSRAVVAAVRGGQAAAGLVYSSDAATAAGCRILFQARDIPAPIRYAGAVVTSSRAQTAAGELLAFLAADESAARFRRCGFS
jgi:molybdenum ABC transporter molybdate-binding protein